MKNVTQLMFAFLLMLLIGSCNSSEKLLCHSWRLVDVQLDEATVNLTKEQKPKMLQQLRDSCRFTFNKDHTYNIKLPQKNEVGVWSFSKNHDTIYSQNDHTGSFSKINVLSETTLDIDVRSRDGSHYKFILTPVQQ